MKKLARLSRSQKRPTVAGKAARVEAKPFVLGRTRFECISAVEGLQLSSDMRDTLDRFEREGLSADERRRAVIRQYAPKR